jgi:hypothetical protein
MALGQSSPAVTGEVGEHRRSVKRDALTIGFSLADKPD